jgi:hypothetical protein
MGVTDGHRTAILGSPAVAATIAGGHNDWTSFYIANREGSNLLRLFKCMHLNPFRHPAQVQVRMAFSAIARHSASNG